MFILGFRHLNSHLIVTVTKQAIHLEFVKYTLMSMEAAIIIVSIIIRRHVLSLCE